VSVLIGSALNGNGIFRLLKALRHEAPNVEDTRKRLGVTDDRQTLVQVMKTIHTSHAGKLSLARVLAGRVDEAMELTNPRGEVGKVSGISRMVGQKSTKRGAASAGETVALGKIEPARTGDTLSAKGGKIAPLAIPAAPQAVLRKVVRSTERKDEVKLSSALQRMVEEDPSLSVTHRQETGETVLGGQGEMHLRVAVERLTGKFGLNLETKPALVPYRETIRGSVTKRGRHKKQSGGHGQFGDVVLEVKPLPRGEGFAFVDKITGGVVPRNYIPAVETGVREALAHGPLGGFPVVDVGVALVDGSYHAVDSSDQAFKMAGSLGMREALPEARPVLLEPILKVKIAVPNDATARVNAIVSGRRGQLLGYDARPGWTGWDVVEALIAEAEIADLIIELRSATSGVGTFTAEFDHMAEVTGRLAEEVLAHAKQKAA
jgi:elongation factor G